MQRWFPGCLVLLFGIGLLPAHGVAADFYLRGAAGYDWSKSADFRDQDCASQNPPALFGCGAGNDGRPLGAYGDFGNFPLYELAAGTQPLKWLRSEVAVTYRPDMEYSGQANFTNTPGEQPVTGEAEAWTGMINLFLEMDELLHLKLGRFTPYLGAGAGVSHNRMGEMTYRFPGLTRHRLSITPSGSEDSFAYMATIGTGYRLSEHLLLDLSYRYSDLGRVETDSGRMYMDSLPAGIVIGGTSASLRTNGLLLGCRYTF